MTVNRLIVLDKRHILINWLYCFSENQTLSITVLVNIYVYDAFRLSNPELQERGGSNSDLAGTDMYL